MAGESNARCERARQWASLSIDGELSELETRLLGRHLEACEGCRTWVESVAGFTAELRAAPLERPQPVELPRVAHVSSPGRRRIALVAVAVAAALGTLLGATVLRSDDPAPEGPPPQFGFLNLGDRGDRGPRPPQVTPLPERPVPENRPADAV
jgi:ferric-dicitrate binding protein FerR (iron transport regulator)